jgi:hypothetical protein
MIDPAAVAKDVIGDVGVPVAPPNLSSLTRLDQATLRVYSPRTKVPGI